MGRSPGAFPSWTERFRGPRRPVDDIVEYLEERFGIRRRDLETEALKAPDDVRHAVEEAWHKIHAKRREQSGNIDPNVVIRLSKHDAENYVGVSHLRMQEKPSPLGYSAWWLTFDSIGVGDFRYRKKGFWHQPSRRAGSESRLSGSISYSRPSPRSSSKGFSSRLAART